MRFRLLSAALISASLLFISCDIIPEVTETDEHPANGRYKGDFQLTVNYVDRTGPSPVGKQRTLTGAVEFTVQGDKVITTPVAGDGEVWWDDGNKTVWVEFKSIASSNESHCSQWRYYGGITGATNYRQGEGTITCLAPSADYTSIQSSYWKVNRQ